MKDNQTLISTQMRNQGYFIAFCKECNKKTLHRPLYPDPKSNEEAECEIKICTKCGLSI